MKDHVTIKSGKHSLSIYLDKDLPFSELLEEAEEKFRASAHFFQGSVMALSFENRVLTKMEEEQMIELISDTAGIYIPCIINHNDKNEKIYKSIVEQSIASAPEPDGFFYRGTLKRRQVLESERSIVVIGDIEDGAAVISKGSILVIGTISGFAHAGAAGRKDAFIAALDMEPARLRIGDKEVKPVIGGSYSWARLS